MTTEERVLKLENAFSTLAQLAASQDERMSSLAQIAARQDERMSSLAQIAARQDARMSGTEQSIRLLLEIAQTQSSRIDDHDERQRQTDAHLDVLGQRMTELATAQTQLAAAQANTERVMSELAARLDHLSETVERYISGAQ